MGRIKFVYPSNSRGGSRGNKLSNSAYQTDTDDKGNSHNDATERQGEKSRLISVKLNFQTNNFMCIVLTNY